MDLIRHAQSYGSRTALNYNGHISRQPTHYVLVFWIQALLLISYQQLLTNAFVLANFLKQYVHSNQEQIVGPRIGIPAYKGGGFVSSVWACWLQNCVAVPLPLNTPQTLLEYYLQDSKASMVLSSQVNKEYVAGACNASGVGLGILEEIVHGSRKQFANADLPQMAMDARDKGAAMLYTSGTTGKPKGVLHTHRSIMSQVEILCNAWEWEQDDSILHALPLHHVHGLVNALFCPLYAGAKVESMDRFNRSEVWDRLGAGNISVLMGVPTMYHQLIEHHKSCTHLTQKQGVDGIRNLRVTISGSAACPVSVQKDWHDICGEFLLERFGMTEIGMALSNPYKGEKRPGSVGVPLTGVDCYIEEDKEASEAGWGELMVKSNSIFKEYWNCPQITSERFTSNGYFKTGDVVVMDGNPPYYRIVGRRSADIIKTAGYKVSALEIESVILQNQLVLECAVLGIPDEQYGEKIGALVVCRDEQYPLTLDELKQYCKDFLPSQKIPRVMLVTRQIPRNAMGKVNKKEILQQFQWV